MIYWLIGSSSEIPELAQGVAPAGLLSPAEERRLAGLQSAKRRHDWLLGRWTAKHLLQMVLEQSTGVKPPLGALAMANGADGAPYAFVDPGCSSGFCIPSLNSVSLSISHCDGYAFCATYPHAILGRSPATNGDVQLGADIEHVESRSPGFVEDYFTEAEIAWLRRAPEAWHDTLVTAIWSAKESALKALHLGLTVDTRRVSCLVSPVAPGGRAWLNLDIRCDPHLLAAWKGSTPRFLGWWRVMGSYVLTVAVLQADRRLGRDMRPVDWSGLFPAGPISKPSLPLGAAAAHL